MARRRLRDGGRRKPQLNNQVASRVSARPVPGSRLQPAVRGRSLLSARPDVVGRTGDVQPRTLQTPRTLASLSGGLQGPGSFSFSGTPTSPISTGANQRLGITLPNGQVVRLGPNSAFTPQQGLQQPGLRLQGLLDLLQGGTLGNGGPSNLLGIRG